MTLFLIFIGAYAAWWFITLPVRTWYAYLAVMALDHGDALPYTLAQFWVLLPNWQKWPRAFLLFRALWLDALLNATYGVVLCWDFTWRDILLTNRMTRYLKTLNPISTGLERRRYVIASHVCKVLLDPYAKGKCHCRV